MLANGRLIRRGAVLVAALLAPLLLWGGSPLPSHGQDSGTLRREIDRGRATERSAASAAARLAALERRAERAVGLMQARLGAAQAELAAREAALEQAKTELAATRRKIARLRARLARDRRTLGEVLRAAYMANRPDLVSVVLTSASFAELVDRGAFYRRVQERNANVIAAVRDARARARRAARRLAVLVPRRARAAASVRRERDALAQKAAALAERQAVLERARAARQALASRARSRRLRAERELRRLEAAQARAAVSTAGPGGPWAIPWAIVQCESGGQNVPPNAAGASGYYQFIPSTWRALGGSTPHAYQASKAEQDRLAARLWNGGRGAGNWDCAAIVGRG